MDAIAVIPARFGATRFPGKPLADRTGKTLIQHVWERVREARRVGRVMVATDDARIAAAVAGFGGEALMTRPDHPSGTDRIAEVVRTLADACPEIVLNVQGDEPEIDPAYLDLLVERLESDIASPMATLAAPFPPDRDPADPNCVKVVQNQPGRALYFSRALIPYPRDSAAGPQAAGWSLHVGVYAYRRAFLLEMAGWGPSELERTEKLEQLRVLERGHTIAIVRVPAALAGVDTPEDYDRFVQRWQRRG